MNSYFPGLMKNQTVKYIESVEHKTKYVKYTYGYGSRLTEIDKDLLCSYIYELEHLAFQLRFEVETIESTSQENAPVHLATKNFPCTVSFSNEEFIVKTPFTVKRGNSKSQKVERENFSLLNYVELAIKQWKREHPDMAICLNENYVGKELVFIIRRNAFRYDRLIHCDCDNLENSKIQNALCNAIGISDRANMLSLFSTFKIVTDEKDIGTEFILTGRKNIVKYI